MKTYTLTNDFHPHECGGTILAGPDHSYCDRCGAFAYSRTFVDEESGDPDTVREDRERVAREEGDLARNDAMPLPGGTDVAANKAAWDDGDDCSPTTTTTTDEEVTP